MKNSISALSVMSVLALAACGSDELSNEIKDTANIVTSSTYFDYNSLLDMPYDNLESAAELIVVDVLKGGRFELPSGCVLQIPENAFAHLNDENVKGEVTLKLKEYKSLGEILLSGIDMKYDSAGVEYDLVSAGMFMIEGFQGETPVKIAKDKSIEVSTVSYIEDSPCFNFYAKDSTDNWNYITTKKSSDNPKLADIPVIKEPVKTNSNDLVFDLSFYGEAAKGLEGIENIMWKYDGERSDTLDLKMFASKNIKNTKIENTGKNQLSFQLTAVINGKIVIMPITPALSGLNYEKALASFNSKMEQMQNNQAALQAMNQGKYIRSISIPNFGIFNWDIIHKAEREALAASFDFGMNISSDFCTIYLISETDNSIVKFNTYSFDKFSYNPRVDNKIIATLPDNKVAVLKGTDFIKQTGSAVDGKVSYKLNLLDKKVTNSKDLDNIIQSL